MKNYVLVIENGFNEERIVLGKVGEFNIENYLNEFIKVEKDKFKKMMIEDGDWNEYSKDYMNDFFRWYKEDIYCGSLGEEVLFDVLEE